MITFTEPPAPDKRAARGAWERGTNAYQGQLVAAYDRWAAATEREMALAMQRGAGEQELRLILERRVALLTTTMQRLTQDGIYRGVKAGLGKRAPGIATRSVIGRKLLENRETVQAKLAPRIEAVIAERITPGMDRAALKAAFLPARSYPATYAGQYWVMIFEVQRAEGLELDREAKRLGRDPARVKWMLDPLAVHCEASEGRYGCPDLEGEYDSWDDLPTVPAGQVSCHGNCRCHLVVWRDGAWRRGLE